MSLILRKDCQPLLDAAGLGDSHVQINSCKNLDIVGKCGQPLATVWGVSFTRKDPTRVEIEYCKELLEEYLAQYGKKVITYMKALRAFRALDPVLQNTKDYEISTIQEWRRKQGEQETITYTDHPLKITLSAKADVKPVIQLTDDATIVNCDEYRYNRKAASLARAYLSKYLDYVKEGQKVEDLKQEMNTCKI